MRTSRRPFPLPVGIASRTRVYLGGVIRSVADVDLGTEFQLRSQSVVQVTSLPSNLRAAVCYGRCFPFAPSTTGSEWSEDNDHAIWQTRAPPSDNGCFWLTQTENDWNPEVPY